MNLTTSTTSQCKPDCLIVRAKLLDLRQLPAQFDEHALNRVFPRPV